MIVERESLMFEETKNTNKEWFPKFIVLRRKAKITKPKDLWQESFNEIASQMTKLESNLKKDTEECKEMIVDLDSNMHNSVDKII